jgi:hypothetical protein
VIEVEVVLMLGPEVGLEEVEVLAKEVEARIEPVWELVGFELRREAQRRVTLLIGGAGREAEVMALVLPLVEAVARDGSHYVVRYANGREQRQRFGALPEWLAGPLQEVLRDMQQPRALELAIWWEPPFDTEWGLVWCTEVGERGRAGMGVTPMESVEDLKVHIADWMQDQWFPETAGAWVEARPECPAHTHPAAPGIPDDVAVWACPKDGRVLARIGEL